MKEELELVKTQLELARISNAGSFFNNSLPKIKDGTYVINLDEYTSIGTHWISLYVNAEYVTYFDSFGFEHIPKEIRKLNKNKNITANIYRKQAYDGFIDFMLKGNSLSEYTIAFSLIDHEKNDEIMLKRFQ